MTDGGKWEGVVLRHLQEMRVRNLREQSIYNRSRALARLAEWAGTPILYLTADDLRSWQHQRTAEISPAARGTEMSNVREFYRWAVREEFLDRDPTARLVMPRAPRRIPRPVADNELAVAFASAEPEMAVILGLAAFAGLRACEIARLDWSELAVRDEPAMLRVVDGKGGHGRLVPMAPTLVELVLALPHHRGPVVRRRDGQAGVCSSARVSQRANDHLHGAGVQETLHQLRHRFGTVTYRACHDLRAVQELLGHMSPTTTAGYAAASPTTALAAVLAAGELITSAEDGSGERKTSPCADAGASAQGLASISPPDCGGSDSENDGAGDVVLTA